MNPMPLPVWIAEPRKQDQWQLLTKLRTEAEAVVSGGSLTSDRAASTLIDEDEHGH